MWRSVQGTVILWMPLPQRDMWYSVRSALREKSSCVGGLDKENEKEILSLLHAKSGNVQGYVREAVESEIYGRDKNYIENISDLCRCHDSQNPEHIYDITKAVIQSAQYMTAVRIRAEPPPVSSLLPVLATAPRLMVYGLCSTCPVSGGA